MKTTTYIRCFIDMRLYNNFNEESKAHELCEKIDIMFQNKNAANQVSVFQKLVRLQYQDGVGKHVPPDVTGWNRMQDAENRLIVEPAPDRKDRDVNMPKSLISINTT